MFYVLSYEQGQVLPRRRPHGEGRAKDCGLGPAHEVLEAGHEEALHGATVVRD